MKREGELYMKQFNWSSGIFLIGYHLLLFILLPIYLFIQYPSWGLIISSIALLYISGLSITAGYHRLFSHSTYKAHPILKIIFLLFGSMATQGSILRWSHDHRLHHAHIDKEEDPYSVVRGFWHAHILWMFKKQPPIKEKVVADLLRDRLIVLQDRYYPLIMFLLNLLATLAVGWFTGDYFGAFVFAWLFRQFLLHHFTWFINSLAHYWGHQHYSTEHTAVDNYILSFLTFGEGYHNYHHTFANDYRNGIYWYHFDPTKWLIWLCSKVGLANSLRKASQARISEQMIKLHQHALLEKIEQSFIARKDDLIKKANDFADSLTLKLREMHKLIEAYKASKKTPVQPSYIEKMRGDLDSLQRSLKREWKEWKQFSKSIMKLKTA